MYRLLFSRFHSSAVRNPVYPNSYMIYMSAINQIDKHTPAYYVNVLGSTTKDKITIDVRGAIWCPMFDH